MFRLKFILRNYAKTFEWILNYQWKLSADNSWAKKTNLLQKLLAPPLNYKKQQHLQL